MTSCKHIALVLLAEKKKMVRCIHCHLRIEVDELGENYCPECYETGDKKHYNFEEIGELDNKISRYRCEDCGIIVNSG